MPHTTEHLKDHKWKKGESGNPGGRPRSRSKLRALLLKHQDEIGTQLLALIAAGDRAAIIWAAECLGCKPLEKDQDLSDLLGEEGANELPNMTADELLAALRLAARAKGDAH